MTNFNSIILATDSRGIAKITLNRPEKHNAMNAQMIAELMQAARAVAADDAVRAVVLAASGKSFCAGADLGWMQTQAERDREGKMAESRALAEMLAALNALPKPLIVRVQGAAYGGAVGLIAVADITVAVEDVRFALTETRLGLIPATIGPFVVRRMGEGFARQVFFTGKAFGTELALRSSLVTRICEPGELDGFIEEEVAAVLKCAPGAVAAAKGLCRKLGGAELATFTGETVVALADRWESEEAQEGIKAFFAKEKPSWLVR